jgi:uncharacterized membrane protein
MLRRYSALQLKALIQLAVSHCVIADHTSTLQEELMKATAEKDGALKAAMDSMEALQAEAAAREVKAEQHAISQLLKVFSGLCSVTCCRWLCQSSWQRQLRS